jgi:hypothetical protein
MQQSRTTASGSPLAARAWGWPAEARGAVVGAPEVALSRMLTHGAGEGEGRPAGARALVRVPPPSALATPATYQGAAGEAGD